MKHEFTNVLHERRVAMFSFKDAFKVQGIKLNGVEIFEPKKKVVVNKKNPCL